MSLKDQYERFLARPASDLLSPNAALHYITTTTTFNGADEITKHLTKQQLAITKKSEIIINAFEGPGSLALEAETCLEFSAGGGAFLLDLDDNFIVDRTVTFLLIHIVQFDNAKKISQIRLYWDQGSLLKQVDAIGPHHRSWPIRDGPQQTRLTRSSVSASQENATNSVEVDNNGACRQTSAFTKSLQSSKTKSNTRPSANLSLFEPEDDFNAQNKKAIETSHQDRTGDSSNLNTKRFSPPKGDLQSSSQPRVETDWVLTPKPASKTFNHFEFGEAEVPVSSTKRTKEHEHFEFGEAKVPSPSTQSKFNKSQSHFDIGEAPPPLPTTKADIPIHSRPSKHASQWDFEDFVTPEKPRQKVRGQNVRHFAWSDDDCEPMETPQRKPRIIHPRRDAAPHFEFEDEGTEVDAQMPLRNTAGATHNKGLKLYENNLYSEVSDTESDKVVNSQVPTSSTNVSRRKDLESHWDMTDEPLIDSTTKVDHSQQNCSDHLKAVKMMDSNWDIYGGGMDGNDDSMVKGPKKSTRKVNQPSWSLGDESP